MSIETNAEARADHGARAARGVPSFLDGPEFLARRKEKWRVALEKILFKDGDIVEAAEQAEDAVED